MVCIPPDYIERNDGAQQQVPVPHRRGTGTAQHADRAGPAVLRRERLQPAGGLQRQGRRHVVQFMPETGKDFDLKQNMFRDDRRDVLASTRAALSTTLSACTACSATGIWHWRPTTGARAMSPRPSSATRRRAARRLCRHQHAAGDAPVCPEAAGNQEHRTARPARFNARLPCDRQPPFFDRGADPARHRRGQGSRSGRREKRDLRQLNPSITKPMFMAATNPERAAAPGQRRALFRPGWPRRPVRWRAGRPGGRHAT